MIIDDNAVNRFALRALVGRLGYAVDLAESGERAVAAVTTSKYAIILVDLMMPDCDGYETARRMRALGVKAPILAITALDDTRRVREACRDAGIDDVFVKPVDPQMLAGKLRHYTATLPAVIRSAQMAPIEPIDREFLRNIYGDDNLPAILQAFLEVTSTLMTKLETAVSEHSDGDAWKSLHELKSATSQLHVKELADLCKAIEAARVNRDWARMIALYGLLSDAFASVRRILRTNIAA